MLFFAFLTGWNGVRPLAFVFAGVKLYALGFYHTMEYTSATPPPEVFSGVACTFGGSIAIALWQGFVGV